MPFAVFLDADGSLYAEPDISVICDKGRITDEGCKGAPDWIAEISIEEENDSQIITFTGEAGKIEEYLRRSMEYSQSPMADMKMKVKKNQGEVMVDSQGYMKSQILKVELTLDMNGSQIDMTINMKLVYHWPGEVVPVELPSTDGYIEVDTESLFNT